MDHSENMEEQEKKLEHQKAFPSFLQVLGMMAVSGLVLLVFFFILAAFSDAFGFDIYEKYNNICFIFAYFLVFSILIIWGLKRSGKKFFELFHFGRIHRKQVLFLLLSIIGYQMFLFSVVILLDYFIGLPQLTESKVLDSPLGLMLLVPLLGPVLEELFFRGMLLPGFARRYGARNSIFITSAMFGILHGVYKFIPTFIFGYFLGWLYFRTKSLWGPVFAHVINNSLLSGYVGIVYLLNYSPEEMNAPTTQTEAIIAGGLFLPGLLVLIFSLRTLHKIIESKKIQCRTL